MMNCSTFLRTLKDYISDEISEDKKKLSDEHVRGCSSCKKIYDEQLKIYKALHSIADDRIEDFTSSRIEILNKIDKTRYSKKLSNKIGFFFRRNSFRYVASGIALMLLICLSPYIYNIFIGSSKMEQIMQDFRGQKINTSMLNIKFSGQVRNNMIAIEMTKIDSFGEDSVFKNFKGSDKSPSEYEQDLIKKATSIGIDEKKLSNALVKAKKYKNNSITQYPVIIDTGVYRGKTCFILTFTWEETSAIKDKNKVQNLGHVFTAIIDEDGNEVGYTSCK